MRPPTHDMTGDEIVALSKKHTIFEWSAQGAVDPIPVARAKGVYFWTPEGKRFIDFNSQLMCVNIGHGDERVVKAIQEQAAVLPYANPFMATEPRARLGAKLAEITPGDIDVLLLHQRRRRGQRERDQDRALRHRPPEDPGALPLVSRRHGRRDRRRPAIRAAGQPSRPLPGIVHVLDPYHGIRARLGHRRRARCEYLEEVIQLEGPQTIAAFILEPVTGTNGILVPPDGYLQGVRALCDKHGILMIADEVMAGFGRTGEWFAVDHWNVVPDMMTMAKGLTSAYVPARRRRHAAADRRSLSRTSVSGRPHLQQPSARRARRRWRRSRSTKRTGSSSARSATGDADGATCWPTSPARHPSVGAVRSIGLFGIVELVRNRDDARADGAVQRHVAGDGGARQVLPRGGALHVRALELLLHEPAADDHRGASCAKGSRSSTAAWRSPIARVCNKR